MAGGEQDEAEKEHAPSAKRLDDARRQGDIAKSADLTAAAALAGLLVAAIAGGPVILAAATRAQVFLGQAAALPHSGGGSLQAFAGGLVVGTAIPLGALMLVPASAALAMLFAQRALVFAPTKLQPKLSRISPIATARQKFGREGLFDFGRNTVKLLVVGGTLWWFLSIHHDQLVVTSSLEPRIGLTMLIGLLGKFLAISVLLALVIGGLDLLWQHHALHHRNRMSRKEMLDEMKESDGDPHAKAARKQRGQDLALNQMLAEVPTAAVVIVNPTHYAVALRWKRGDQTAPVVVAKGVDEAAHRIRAAAQAAGVPIHADPPTARAIHASVKLGQPIQPDHFRAVAAAIRFADRMRHRARKG